jgi:hypothetical protein
MTQAFYQVSVRHFQNFVISFLQIPPHDGHPCLDGQFRLLRPVADFHRLSACHAWHTRGERFFAPDRNGTTLSEISVCTPKFRARDFSRHGEQFLRLWSSLDRPRFHPVRSAWQQQTRDCSTQICKHGTAYFASSAHIHESAQNALCPGKTQLPWQHLGTDSRLRHCRSNQVICQEKSPHLLLHHVRAFATQDIHAHRALDRS